jgi:hypothetical protein
MVKLHCPKRKSTEAPVPNVTLSWNDLQITIDEQYMPTKLVRLLPPAYVHATEEQWKPFITLAIAMGLMK